MRRRLKGVSLTEYALPLFLILVVGGVLFSILSLTKIMDGFFISASGHEKDRLKDGTFDAHEVVTGDVQNGSAGFKDFGSVSNGAALIPANGKLYLGSVQRGDRVQALGSNGSEFLYALDTTDPANSSLAKLVSMPRTGEYVSRVLFGANTTKYLGLVKGGLASGSADIATLDVYTRAVIAQNASNLVYAISHQSEVNRFGGMQGVTEWDRLMDQSVKGSQDVKKMAKDLGTASNQFQRLAQLRSDYDQRVSAPGQVDAIDSGYSKLQNEPETMKEYTQDAKLDEEITYKYWQSLGTQ